MMQEQWLLPREIYSTEANRGYLRVCQRTFYHWIRCGVLPKLTRHNGKKRLNTRDIDAAMIAKARGITFEEQATI